MFHILSLNVCSSVDCHWLSKTKIQNLSS